MLCIDFTRSVSTVLSSGHLSNSCDLENWPNSTRGLFHLISAVRIQNSLALKTERALVTGKQELKPDTTTLDIVQQDALPLKRNLILEIYENLVEHQSSTTIPHHLFQKSNSGGTQRARPMILVLQTLSSILLGSLRTKTELLSLLQLQFLRLDQGSANCSKFQRGDEDPAFIAELLLSIY